MLKNIRWRAFIRYLKYNRKQTQFEKTASKIGYMGTGFILAAHWTVEPWLFIIGFICTGVQVISRKQWNLAVLNINGIIAWTKNLLTGF